MLRCFLAAALAASLAFPLPKGWSVSIQAERSQRSGPQSCVLWRGQERLCAAARRFLWLLLAKWLAAKRFALLVQPKTIRAAEEAVIVEVTVEWAGASVPRLNTDKSHHITLCRCGGTARAKALADKLQARGAPWLWEKGVAREQLARDLCLFRTARRVEGLERLLDVLREEVLEERLAFEPDQRGCHVSL